MRALGRRISIVFAALLVAAAVLVLAPGASWSQAPARVLDGGGGAPYVAGELVVTYESGAAAEVEEAASREAGETSVEKELPEIGAQLLSFPEIKSEQAREDREGDLERAKRALEQDPAVEAVDYNYVYEIASNDPLFDRQHGLIRAGFPGAWRKARGANTRIAVVDTGSLATHPDLAGKIAGQKDFVNDDNDANDDNGHGTHISGIAAAVTGNGQGVAGGCPDCELLIAKTFNASGTGTLDVLAEGITWAVDPNGDGDTTDGAKVINMSFAGPASVALGNAVDYAASKGVVLVAAAGNRGSNRAAYPAAYPNVIAVAASDGSDRGASFSNYGRWVDVAAPGVSILSTTSDGGYGPMSGTSMASAEVAALAGLLASQGRSRSEITSRILGTATKLAVKPKTHRKKRKKGSPSRYYGRGRINAALAVQSRSGKNRP